MNKRYNKSESRKDRPYNKSLKRRPHPPYHELQHKPYKKKKKDDVPDFNIELPKVDWELPTLGNIEPVVIQEVPEVKTPPSGELASPAPPSTKKPAPKVKVQPRPDTKRTSPQPRPRGQKQTTKPPPQRRNQLPQKPKEEWQQHPRRPQPKKPFNLGTIIVPIFIMIFIVAILPSELNFVKILIVFFFGSQIWAMLQGNNKKK